MNKILKAAALATVMGVGAIAPANASIVGAVGAVINSGGPGQGDIEDTYDQSGLSTGYVSGVTDFDSYIGSSPSHTPTFSGFEWFSNLGTTSASVTYDLGSVLSINRIALWNEESSGIGLLDLLVSSDGNSFTSLLAGYVPTDNPLASYLADVISFATTSFRYVQFDMSGCPQQNPGTYRGCAIGEVAFNNVAAVPVPAAGLLLLGALGGLAALRRRKTA